MGLGAKLNFAFITVIIVMVISHAAFQVIGERNAATASAHKIVDPAIKLLSQDINAVQTKNRDLASRLSADPAFISAWGSKNREAVANAVRAFEDRMGMPGFVTVIDDKGKVFYSSDSPAKFGYAAHDQTAEVSNVLMNQWWAGASSLTAAGTLSVTGMVPITAGGRGVLAVSQPLNTEFLTGLQKKFELTQGLQSLDMLIFSVKDGKVDGATPGLMNRQDGGFVTALDREGMKPMKDKPEAEFAGRIWKAYRFEDTNHHPVAYVLVTTPMPDIKLKLAAIAGQAAISGVAALFLGLLLSMGIAGKVNKSMDILVQRAKDLAAHKKDMPSLYGLSSEWMELAQTIDMAVATPRSSVKSLQNQMGKHQTELEERQKQIEASQQQVEHVNRQLMNQSKQLSEVSKQINHANAQAILLQQKLASVLQISTEGFLILDPFGNVFNANPTFVNWSGLAEAEIAGRFCFDLVRKPGDPREPMSTAAFSRHIANPGDLIAQFFPEGFVYHRSGEKAVEVLVHLQPVMTDDRNIQGYIMVLRDKSLHSEAARLRSEIVSMLQDSIRQPLVVAEQKWSSVLSASSQAGNSAFGPTLIDLHGSYQQVLGIVDSLLMMHAGIVPTSPVIRDQVSITRLVGDCLEQAAPQARAHQIMLDYKTVTGLPTTAVDKDIVRDVLVQLLEKMISVTAPGGRVRVESGSKGNEIRLSIFSSGPALPAPEIEDMFAGFIQGKHTEDTYGARLALYLVRNNIERLGGRVWAESDRGTYIYFILPVQ